MGPGSELAEVHVVFGGTGAVGSAVVEELVKQGKPTRVVSRSATGQVPRGVELVAASISRIDEARAACRGATHLYFCANPAYVHWSNEFPPLLEGAIAAAEATGAKLIMADNLYIYPHTAQPMTEDLPWNPPSRKGKLRKEMDERLLAAHRSGAIRAVIGRASDFHGPRARTTFTLGELFFTNYFAGKPVTWVGKLDMPHTFSYVTDFGRGLVTLGEFDQALGQAWHIPAAEPLTSRQLLDLAFEEGGRKAKIRAASGRMLSLLGIWSPLLREVAEMAYEFEAPFIMDSSKFARAFGSNPTPHREAVRTTIEWFRANVPSQH